MSAMYQAYAASRNVCNRIEVWAHNFGPSLFLLCLRGASSMEDSRLVPY